MGRRRHTPEQIIATLPFFHFRLQPTKLEQQRCGVGTVPHGRP